MPDSTPVVAVPTLGGLDCRIGRDAGKAEFTANTLREAGLLGPRPPMRARIADGGATRLGAIMGAYAFRDWQNRQRLCVVGADASTGSMLFHLIDARDLSPLSIIFTRNLTSLHSVVYDAETHWCFEEHYGKVRFSSPEAPVLQYDPRSGELEGSVTEPTRPNGNQIGLTTHGYYTKFPGAGIMRFHNGLMYYAGFRRGEFHCPLSEPIDLAQLKYPKDLVQNGGYILVVDHRMVMVSEPDSPDNVMDLFFEIVGQKDPVTLLSPMGDALVVGSLEGLKQFDVAANDQGLPSMTLRKITIGIGCTARASGQETEAGVFFLGSNGVYLYDGQGGARCVSDAIAGLWQQEGLGAGILPAVIEQNILQAGQMPLPLRVVESRQDQATSAHIRSRGLYLIGLPIQGRDGNGLLAAYDYREDNWYLWISPDNAGVDKPVDFNALTVERMPWGDEWLWIGSKAGGIALMRFDLRLQSDQDVVYTAAGGGREVSYGCIWQNTLLQGTDYHKEVDGVRFRCLHGRRAGSTVGGYVYVENEEGVWTAYGAVSASDETTWPGRQKLQELRTAPNQSRGADFTYYHDVGLHDKMVHARRDIVTSLAGAVPGRSDWFRIGLYWPSDSPRTRFHSMSLDIRQTEETKR